MFQWKIENLWLKLLLTLLIFCGILIIPGYLYYRNSSCLGNVWNCFEFEIIMLGGGVLLFSLPLVVILFLWEISKKIKEKKREAMDMPVAKDKPEEKDRLSEAISKYMNNKNYD